MAEALVAVGIASNVFQIVGFGASVIKTTYTLVKASSDALREDIQLRRLAQQQIDVADKLHDELTSKPALNEKEQVLVKLSGECRRETARLIGLLNSLKVTAGSNGVRRVVRSAKIAIKIQRKRQEIEDHRKNLQLINGQLATVLLGVLRDENESKAVALEQAMETNKTDVLAAILDIKNGVKACLDQQEDRRQTRLRKIVNGLLFPDMQSRQHAIPNAYPETYSWALEQDTSGLRTWLQSGSNIYWISGKAGSGKSTLMKFLGNDPRTRKCLTAWSGGSKGLVVIDCYFWYAGSVLQKSIEGLLRTILYHILHVYPDLVPTLLPDKWACVQDTPHVSINWWSEIELRNALKGISRVITQVYSQTAEYATPKFCLFIDGLDEYAGNHGQLVQTLREFASGDDTKLCVSSRPWNVFSRAFGNSEPHLLLQDLTHGDIKLYVESTIGSALSRSVNSDPADASELEITSLSSEIVYRAEGVFLWVYLVVQSVLRGLDEGDHITTLRQRVLEFPRDLEHFFGVILERVESVYHQQTIQALCLAYLYVGDSDAADRSSYLDFELLRRSPTGLWDSTYLWDLQPQVLSEDGFSALAQRARLFLGACCKDLLTLPWAKTTSFASDPAKLKVQFLHRTVYDYLQTTGRIEKFMQEVPPTFKDGSAFHLLNMAKLKLALDVERPSVSAYFIKQTSYSLFDSWPGLTLEFVEQLQRSQIMHQRSACSSIAAAYIAFEQYSTFRIMYSNPGRKWFDGFKHMSEHPGLDEAPQQVLLRAALGMAECNRFPLTSINTDFLSFLLGIEPSAPDTIEMYDRDGVLPDFFIWTLDSLRGTGEEATLSASLWTAFLDTASVQHLCRISQVLLEHSNDMYDIFDRMKDYCCDNWEFRLIQYLETDAQPALYSPGHFCDGSTIASEDLDPDEDEDDCPDKSSEQYQEEIEEGLEGSHDSIWQGEDPTTRILRRLRAVSETGLVPGAA